MQDWWLQQVIAGIDGDRWAPDGRARMACWPAVRTTAWTLDIPDTLNTLNTLNTWHSYHIASWNQLTSVDVNMLTCKNFSHVWHFSDTCLNMLDTLTIGFLDIPRPLPGWIEHDITWLNIAGAGHCRVVLFCYVLLSGRALQRFYPKLFIYDLEEMGTSSWTLRKWLEKCWKLQRARFESIWCRKEEEKRPLDMEQAHTHTDGPLAHLVTHTTHRHTDRRTDRQIDG